ncbi:MAG: hypothetical protein ACR2OD_08280 [Gaiellaceae bacterium]
MPGAALAAATLFPGLAGFQAALALGAPLGAVSWGGRRPGLLPGPLRLSSAAASVVFTLFAAVLLARGRVITTQTVSARTLSRATRGIAAAMAFNTLGNVTSASPTERYDFGSLTLALAILTTIVEQSAEPECK